MGATEAGATGAADPARPAILLIGDSISVRYAPFLRRYLRGAAGLLQKDGPGSAEENLDIPAGSNGGDSRMVLAYLSARLRDPALCPDVLLLNCGLHDIKRELPARQLQVSLDEYLGNLGSIFDLAQRYGIRTIWISSTPVYDEVHNRAPLGFIRHADDLVAYNHAARTLCRGRGLDVIDLHSFSQELGPGELVDHVHYSERARQLQAAYIAGAMGQLLEG